MRSAAEQEIRDAVVQRLRELFPGSRIIHELNVNGQGSKRLDVAAVDKQTIIGAELKSSKDTLERLGTQWPEFIKCCHFVAVVAHAKHFKSIGEGFRAGELILNHPLFSEWHHAQHVWHFPKPAHSEAWAIDSRHLEVRAQPRAVDILSILWASELRSEMSRHGLTCKKSATRGQMIRQMAWAMTGREICEAVCRQLRGRTFAEADPPIYVSEPVRPSDVEPRDEPVLPF